MDEWIATEVFKCYIYIYIYPKEAKMDSKNDGLEENVPYNYDDSLDVPC